MNSDTRNEADEIVRKAGAIIDCPHCHAHSVSAGNLAAESHAVALAMSAARNSTRGFRGMGHREVVTILQTVIQEANLTCPLNVTGDAGVALKSPRT